MALTVLYVPFCSTAEPRIANRARPGWGDVLARALSLSRSLAFSLAPYLSLARALCPTLSLSLFIRPGPSCGIEARERVEKVTTGYEPFDLDALHAASGVLPHSLPTERG